MLEGLHGGEGLRKAPRDERVPGQGVLWEGGLRKVHGDAERREMEAEGAIPGP
jgi:hypothetical protein